MQEFEEELKKYRFWNYLAIIIFLSYLPLGLLLDWLAGKVVFFENFFVLMPIWLLLLIFSVFKTGFYRCPRCKKSFSRKNWYRSNSLGRYCVHCGLSAFKKK